MNTLSSLLKWLGNTIGANPSTLTTSSKKLVGAINEVNRKVNKGVPIGAVEMFAGNYTPSGWLRCDGSTVSRSTYAELFTAIGTRYGEGDGSTTFKLPNFNGRVPIGVGTSGTTGASSHALASTGGQETHTHTTGNCTLTVNQIPAHRHTFKSTYGTNTAIIYGRNTSDGGGNALSAWNGYSGSENQVEMQNTGGGQAHNHGNTGSSSQMNPYLAVNFIIYSGVY